VHLNIRLIGRLTEFERSDGAVTFAHRASIIEVLSELGIPHDQVGPVSLNDSIVSKERWGATELSEGDQLTVMPPIKGG
jgi:thiamine biosynthesis protein ThiS